MLIVGRTYTTRYMSIVGNGITKNIAYHGIAEFIIILMCCQVIIDQLECLYPVIIIRIDDCKWSIHLIDAAKYCMCRSPWLHSALRHAVSVRKIIKFLISIRYFHIFRHTVSDCFTERFFIFSLYNKYDFLKASSYCIINGKVHDNMTFFVNRIDLFQTSIAASHSCCHYY